jgi:hypothetical protein
MRFQFGTKAILLATAFVAIACGGYFALVRMGGSSLSELPQLLLIAAIYGPLWLPFAFLGYIIGWKSLTARTIIVFALSEAAAVGIHALWLKQLWP